MTIIPLTYLGGIEWFTRLLEGAYGDGVGGGGGCVGDGAVIDLGENWVKQTARNRCEIMTPGGPATLTVPVHGGSGWVTYGVSGGFGGSGGIDGGREVGGSGGGRLAGGKAASGKAAGGKAAGGKAAGGGKLRTRDVRIDNFRRWQHVHWLSMVSGYRNSPFFDHYQERFAPIYERKFDFLIDLNLALLEVSLSVLGLDVEIQVSENYVVAAPGDMDLRGKKALRRMMAAGGDAANDGVGGATGSAAGGVAGGVAEDSAVQVAGYYEYTQVFSDRIAFVPGLSIVDLIFCEGPGAREILMRGAIAGRSNVKRAAAEWRD